jgi:hypothetical protein
MASMLEMQMTGQLGGLQGGVMGGGEKDSIPLLAALRIRDSKTGTLGAFNTNGIQGKESDAFGLFRRTKLDEIIRGGRRGEAGSSGVAGGGGDVSEVSAPAPSTPRVSGSGMSLS